MGSISNHVQLIGRLTKDPELTRKQREDGKETVYTKFSIAVNRRGKDAGAEFFNITYFGVTAEFIVKYFKKGDPIPVSGHLQSKSYTDKNGNKVFTVEIIGEDTEFLPFKQASGGTGPVAEASISEKAPMQQAAPQQYQESTGNQQPTYTEQQPIYTEQQPTYTGQQPEYIAPDPMQQMYEGWDRGHEQY